MSVRVEFRWPESLLERVDAARGPGQPRADWIRRAVERALEGLDHSPRRVDVGDRDPVPAPAEQPENQYVSVYDHDENAELPEGDEFARGPKFGTFPVQPERRVSPPKLVSPRVPSHPPCLIRRDVKPFPRGDK